MARGDNLRPEWDREVAHLALLQGDLVHASLHLASAVAADPARDDLLDLLDALADRGGPEMLAPLDESEPWIGMLAVHAWVRARRGDLRRALDLLARATAADLSLLAWLERWRPIEPSDVAATFAQLLARSAEPDWFARLLAALDPFLDGDDPDAAVLRAVLAGRAGAQDARAVAAEVFERWPCYGAAVALAAACRAEGDVAGAEAAYRAAADLGEDPIPAWLDLGDLLLKEGRLPEAEACYRHVLAGEPEHAWARPSLLYARYLRESRPEDVEALHRLAEEGGRAEVLARLLTPWVGYLPPPREAVIEVVRRAAHARGARVPPAPGPRGAGVPPALQVLSARVSHLEAPSALPAARLEAARLGLELRVEIAAVPDPDPRVGLGGTALWHWERLAPRPAVDPPLAHVSELVADLARFPWHLDRYKRRAAGAAVSPEEIPDVVATAVHPPACPEGCRAWTWVQRVQLAAALLLAARGRAALWDLARGPVDWTTAAALVVLTEVALDEPGQAPAVRGLLETWFQRAPDAGHWCLDAALTHALLRLPGGSPEIREALRTRRARLWSA